MDVVSHREDAIEHVSVPESVKDLIISLRTFLQDTCEPPVYVSDRRLLKSIALLKVVSFAVFNFFRYQSLAPPSQCLMYSGKGMSCSEIHLHPNTDVTSKTADIL